VFFVADLLLFILLPGQPAHPFGKVQRAVGTLPDEIS